MRLPQHDQAFGPRDFIDFYLLYNGGNPPSANEGLCETGDLYKEQDPSYLIFHLYAV